MIVDQACSLAVPKELWDVLGMGRQEWREMHKDAYRKEIEALEEACDFKDDPATWRSLLDFVTKTWLALADKTLKQIKNYPSISTK
jgi:ABC-type nitrate/sulfonate/bicarbonate transport system substrate-binding protein